MRRIQGKPLREYLQLASVRGFGAPEHRSVRLQQDVDGGDWGLFKREDLAPIVLHTRNGPAFLLRLVVKRSREGSEFWVRQSHGRAVGVFACRIIVKHQQHEARAAVALRVFQHFFVAIGIAKRGDGTAADVLVDANRLVTLVINEVQLRQTHENGFAIAHFKLRLDAATDDLPRRNAINPLRPRAHEFDAPAGNDEVREAVRSQIGAHFEHRLINHVSKELAGFRMLRCGDPVFHDLLKFGRGHAGVCGHDDFDQRMVAASKCCLQITLEQRGERLRGVPLRVLRRERLDAIKRKIQLHRHWLLAP